MLNGERDYSLLGQRKYLHARINPNPIPIANHNHNLSLNLTLKSLNESEWKVFMAKITEKSATYVFPLT